MTVMLSPWKLRIWTDQSKTVSVTPTAITRIDVQITRTVSAAAQFTITGVLSDYTWQQIGVPAVDRGMYFELTRSRDPSNPSPPLWENGYIQTVTKNTSQPMSIVLTAVSPLWFLSNYRTPMQFSAGPGFGFTGVLDLLNGVPAHSTTPGQIGLLPPNWSAVWLDGVNPALGKSATTDAGVGGIWQGGGETALIDISDNLAKYNIFFREKAGRVNYGDDCVLEIGPLGDAALNGTGGNITYYGSAALTAKLQGDVNYPTSRVRADLKAAADDGLTVIANAQFQSDLTQIKNVCYVLGKAGPENSMHNVMGGPPTDGSGTPINGWTLFAPSPDRTGRKYYIKSNTNYATYDGQVFTYIATQEDVAGQWQYGVIDITSANAYGIMENTIEDTKATDAVTLIQTGVGFVASWGQPVVSFTFDVIQPLEDADGNPTRVYPGQTVVVKYSGEVPKIERDGDGQWQNQGATVTYMEYPGTTDVLKIVKLARVVQVDESYQGSLVRQTVTLGQSRTNAKSFAENLARELMKKRHGRDHRSPSFTKYSFEGLPWLFMSSPHLAYDDRKDKQIVINPGAIAATDVTHPFALNDGHHWRFTVDLTACDTTSYLDCWMYKPINGGPAITSSLVSAPDNAHFVVTSGDAKLFGEGLPVLVGAQYSIISNVDTSTDTITVSPSFGSAPLGAVVQYPMLLTPNPGAGNTYPALRLALRASGVETGFVTTSNGAIWTPQGTTHANPFLAFGDADNQLAKAIYDIDVTWQQNHFEARIIGPDGSGDNSGSSHMLASWSDTSPTGTHIIDPTKGGAIGYMLHQGSGVAKLWNIHAQATTPHTITRVQHHPHHPSSHQFKNLLPVVTAWDKVTGEATVQLKILVDPAYLMLQNGLIAENAAVAGASFGTPIYWAKSRTDLTITGLTQATGVPSGTTKAPWIVYNGENYDISDGSFTVAAHTFGKIQLTKTGKHSWDNVYVIGSLSEQIDPHTKKPWVEGWHTGSHQGAGVHTAISAIGRQHGNPHQPAKKKRKKSSPGGTAGGAAILRVH